LEALTGKGAVLALALGSSLKKSAVNAAVDTFEMQAICSQVERDVHARVAAHGDDLYTISAMPIGTPFESRRSVGQSSKLRQCGSDVRLGCGHCPSRSAVRRSMSCGRF
jgi:hypothetical protein